MPPWLAMLKGSDCDRRTPAADQTHARTRGEQFHPPTQMPTSVMIQGPPAGMVTTCAIWFVTFRPCPSCELVGLAVFPTVGIRCSPCAGCGDVHRPLPQRGQ